MKTINCKKCGKLKKICDFYETHRVCKECYKEKVKKRYYSPENREKIREYEFKRNRTPERKKARLEYQKKRRFLHKEKYLANNIVSKNIIANKLKRQPCEICGEKKSEAHHSNYSKPLEIMWLCLKHHREWHKNNKLKKTKWPDQKK